jgi:hypothetical protein
VIADRLPAGWQEGIFSANAAELLGERAAGAGGLPG